MGAAAKGAWSPRSRRCRPARARPLPHQGLRRLRHANCFDGGGAARQLSRTHVGTARGVRVWRHRCELGDYVAPRTQPEKLALACVPLSLRSRTATRAPRLKVDFCNVQFPPNSASLRRSRPVGLRRVYELGTTEAPARARRHRPARLRPADLQPMGAWLVLVPRRLQRAGGQRRRVPATFIAPAAPGVYRYGYRFTLDGSALTLLRHNGAGSTQLSFETNSSRR